MNIWVEYWRRDTKTKNTTAQIREQAKWIPPDPKDVQKRFCQSREDASRFAKSMQEQGYHVLVKTD
jgi:hypothetical protein|tara:strand:- start:2945 stop:3142 length:198 start_codon:yes stop_codon:yes gene_type:complete